jgi:hypothetical protein
MFAKLNHDRKRTKARAPLTSRVKDLNHYVTVKYFMVIYNLVCRKKHSFEGWFPNFEEYQKQADKKQISCPTCGSKKVEKVPHACAVHVKKQEPAPPKKERSEAETAAPAAALSPAEFKEMLIRVHHYVNENFKDVGPRFAEEARQIHNGKADERPIHGTATVEETKELSAEGIPVVALPKPELDS